MRRLSRAVQRFCDMVFCRQLAAGQEVAAAAVLAVVPCLRIYQLDIILTVENLLANLPAAGAVYAPCGVGKTLIFLTLVAYLRPRRTILFMPLLQLIAQFIGTARQGRNVEALGLRYFLIFPKIPEIAFQHKV